MFRAKFLIGCLFVVAGTAWPQVSITRALKTYSNVYSSAAHEHRKVEATQKRKVVAAVEQGVASILGGLALGLFGIGLGLGAKRHPLRTLVDTPDPVNAGSLGVHISGGPAAASVRNSQSTGQPHSAKGSIVG